MTRLMVGTANPDPRPAKKFQYPNPNSRKARRVVIRKYLRDFNFLTLCPNRGRDTSVSEGFYFTLQLLEPVFKRFKQYSKFLDN